MSDDTTSTAAPAEGVTAPAESTTAPAEDRCRCNLLSIVIPCFNEEEVLAQTHRRLVLALEDAPADLEFVYVDDGSRDATLNVLRTLRRTDERVRVVALSRNFGHQNAATAGLAHAAGDAVALIDADLQDPPEVIAEMLARWQEGADVAYGVRTRRDGESAFKLGTAYLFYRLLGRLVDVAIPVDTGDFRLMDRRAVDALLAMPERDRFVRGMVAWTGFRQVPVRYRRLPRAAGQSEYPLRRMLRLAADGLLSFSRAPLRLATWLGLVAVALALLGAGYAALTFVADAPLPGSALLFVAMLFLGGAQLVSIGVLGEYVARIYGEVKRRPLYFVKERLGFPSAQEPSSKEAP